MQIKLIPDSTGTVWNEATASRPDGRRGAIMAGCGVMALPTTDAFLNRPRCLLHWQCSAHHEAQLLFFPHGQTTKTEDFLQDTVTHAEPCMNADSDRWRSVASSGLQSPSVMLEEKIFSDGEGQLCDA